ncbi:MAG: addiction module protein [Ferruginibacter sp.]
MNIEAEKRKIIDGLMEEHDEWVLKAIKKLLDLDYADEIPEAHKNILNDRIAAYNANPSDTLDWETIKKDLSK